MRIVKDKDGGDWKLPSFSVGIVLDVKEQAGFDILAAKGKTGDEAKNRASEMLAQLYDPFTLGGILWVLLGAQAKDRGLDERAFGYQFDETCYPDLRTAIMESIVDFTQPPPVAKTTKAELPGRIVEIETAWIAALKSLSSASAAPSASTAAGSL